MAIELKLGASDLKLDGERLVVSRAIAFISSVSAPRVASLELLQNHTPPTANDAHQYFGMGYSAQVSGQPQ